MYNNNFKIILIMIFLICILISCKDNEEVKNQINKNVVLLRDNIKIPFQVDSVSWAIITKDYGWELSDHTLLAIIYPSNIDSVKYQLKGYLLKQISGNNFQRYLKHDLQEWFVEKANDKILTTENYYQLEWDNNIYKTNIFHKNGFIHGLCFEHEDKVFIILNTD